MILSVSVKTSAKQDRVVTRDDNSFNIELKAQPRDGKANTALIRLLAKHFGVAQAAVNIKRGATAKHKIIEVTFPKGSAL